MLDYTGDISYYQRQLTAAGITEDQVDMSNYVGCTARELQATVDYFKARYADGKDRE